MKLESLLEELSYELKKGSIDTRITTLVYDSRKVEPGSVFVCISGTKLDAHDFIEDTARAGAAAVVVEKDVEVTADITVIRVADTRLALACMSAAYFGHPARRLKTIGITGTKGKTTTTYMVKSILETSGIPTGLIGTIEVIIGDTHIHAENTTPESYQLQEYLAQMVEAGLEAVVMEVSSQGLMLHRVSGFVFDYGVFTNLEPDHIGENEHRDFAHYLHCKSLLFRQCRQGIFNADSEHFQEILAGHTCQVQTYGFSPECDFYPEDLELFRTADITGLRYHLRGLMELEVELNVPGRFNVYNSLAAIAICHHFGVPAEQLKAALASVHVKGRLEIVPTLPHVTVMIDYAHNAMALESLLTTLREYEPGRLICLFGCGGNRARARRFEMGEVSSRLADITVVTSDNPRFEDPMDIIQDILTGVARADGESVTIPDRQDAVIWCLEQAKPGDMIVLAGKGHEDYQEIKGVKHHMDERELIYNALHLVQKKL
ncbi:MAG: UDP-N-acetylmuramoyl-L-alanyl-D-glutamate--2,6-diaminopimelate ligase [Lachnospiraceae bacterium]|nr:UDP-N-acetylmuramoyl-L-alanyl-D-glutamate--2,6-diaminopimelate ligase [Lachnospiraceae bacterium]MCI9150997.1 UDP-N-acetylmuramoyl-L-alanyl-D-glutamate--2,6-diaminopimelate ligase [Lachnospiraceae bacterium]